MTISNRVIGHQGCVDRVCHKFPARPSPVVLGPLSPKRWVRITASRFATSLRIKLLPFALEYECRPVMRGSPAVIILHRSLSCFERRCGSQSFTEHFLVEPFH